MSSFRLTAEQSRATRPDAHIWVDASAGTGKTHVLTARVLRLMVDGARPDSILCLTYTKAAAGEMVNRILTRLGQWATLDRQTLREELSVLLGGRSLVSPAHEKRARQLFLTVLDLPSGLNVQTLHAFSQSLLGRFPLESATAPSFETIDDRTAREYASDARDTVLEAALTAQGLPLATAAQTLAQLMSDSSFDAAVNELLGMRTQLEALPKRFEDLSALVHQVLDVPATSDAEVLIADACGDTAFDQSGLQAVRSAIESAGSASEKRTKLPALEQWLRSHTQARAALFDTYARVFLTEKGSPRSAKGLATKAVLKVYPEALDVMTQEAERLVAVREAIALAKLAKETSYVLAFGQALVTRYAARKERAGKLDFSDLIDRTRQLLQSSVPASWVMFRLDAQIDHILIDEAQDNSSVQWDIVSRLADEFFSGLGQQDQPRSLFAVGDMKQSIYGFQGAQPRLFHDSRTAFKGQSRQAHQVFEDVQLAKSFRSVGAVLDVVDETFRGEAGDGLDAQRVTIRHQTHRAGTAGMVDLWPLSLRAEKEEDESDEGWRLPLQERWEKKPDRLLAEAIATDIQARIDAKECLPGRTQPLSGGDFLILVRQRGDLMSHLARALKQKGVPIAGLDRFDLKSPLAVRDLVNLGRFASLPTDDFALACVLKSPLCNVSEKALLSLCSGRAGTLWDAVKTSDLVDGAAKALLRSVLAKADYMPPFELFSAVLEQGGRTRLLERLSTEAEDAINVFLGQCLQYEQDHTPSLDGFMHWLGQSDVDVKRDPEAAGDYVRLMTIHGAKGLQAPVVYLADLAGTPRPRAQFVTLTSDKGPRLDVPIFRRNARNDIGPVGAAAEAKKQADYEEYKRLLYVAMTRAEDHLVCAGYAAQTPRSGSMLDAYQLVSAAFDRLEVPSDPQSGVRRYQTGKALEQRDAQTEPVRRSKTQLPAWAHAAPAPEQTPPRPLQPSHMPSDGPTHFPAAQLGGADAALSPARRGTLIHALLEHLPALPEAERFAVGKAYLDRMLSPAESDAANAMLTEALMVLDMPSASAFFAAESKAEVPIIARLGDFLVSGKVDRLAVTRDAVLFADFKTTEQAPPSAAQTAPATLRQMALYQASLQKVFEGKPVKAALIWTAEPRVDWLDAVWLLPYLPPGANTAFTRASA